MDAPDSPPSRDLGAFLAAARPPAGWEVHYQAVVDSTMAVARQAASRRGAPRRVFTCDLQTAGRGRQGRAWEAASGRGLLFTVLLNSDDPPLLGTMAVAVALAESVERLVGVQPDIKWPNDLMLAEAKLAGVLAESFSVVAPRDRGGAEIDGGQDSPAAFVSVGCGLNVNQTAAELAALGRAATSLRVATGAPVHRGLLLFGCLERLDVWLSLEAAARAVALREAWQARLWGLGRSLLLRDAGEEFRARIESVDLDGALVVRPADGRARRIVAGEIVVDGSRS